MIMIYIISRLENIIILFENETERLLTDLERGGGGGGRDFWTQTLPLEYVRPLFLELTRKSALTLTVCIKVDQFILYNLRSQA